MQAHKASLINALTLIIMSAWAYFTTENPSVTALIPGFFGIVILALNGGVKKENKVIAHIVVVLTLLIIIALGKPLSAAIADGRNLSILRVGLMLLTSIIAMYYFVKSFIDARKKST